ARAVLSGEPGPVRNTVVLNAGAALAAARGVPRAEDLAGVLVDACARAASAVDSGAALALLDRWVGASPSLAAENSWATTRRAQPPAGEPVAYTAPTYTIP